MFRIVTVEDVVRIPPQKFGDPIDDVAKEQIKLKYENYVDEALGYVILVTGVDVEGTGKILPRRIDSPQGGLQLAYILSRTPRGSRRGNCGGNRFRSVCQNWAGRRAAACLPDHGRLHHIRRKAWRVGGPREP